MDRWWKRIAFSETYPIQRCRRAMRHKDCNARVRNDIRRPVARFRCGGETRDCGPMLELIGTLVPHGSLSLSLDTADCKAYKTITCSGESKSRSVGAGRSQPSENSLTHFISGSCADSETKPTSPASDHLRPHVPARGSLALTDGTPPIDRINISNRV